MDHDCELLLKLLSEERHDLLQLLDLKHKALIAAFKDHRCGASLQRTMSQRSRVDDFSSNVRDERRSNLVVTQECEQVEHSTSHEDKNILASSSEGSDSKGAEVYSVDAELQILSRNSEERGHLAALFDLVDSNGNGVITLDEVRGALQKLGQSPAQARRLVLEMKVLCKRAGAHDGNISRDVWIRVVESDSHINVDITELAIKLRRQHSVVAPPPRKKWSDLCPLSVSSIYRLFWDIFCSICTVYIALFVPYWIGFDLENCATIIPPKERTWIGHVIDVVFMLDVLLNFFTSYKSRGQEVRHWRSIALHYLGSWFLIDVASSIPVSFVTASQNETNSVKILKFLRFFAMLKVFRSAKAFHVMSSSALAEIYEDFTIAYRLQGKSKLLFIVITLALCCHWLACLMAACGLQFLLRVPHDILQPDDYYIPSVYWALTTMSTVGYGDIVPTNDSERVVAMFAMCVGGIIYGLSTGTFTSIFLAEHQEELERSRRKEIVHAWLCRHAFPRALERRLRSYFRTINNHKTNYTSDELHIFENLTNEFRSEVAHVLVPDEVREVPIFKCVPQSVVGFIASVLQMTSFEPKQVVVRVFEVGVAMYIIMAGHCVKRTPPNPKNVNSGDELVEHLFVGESFGEEIVLGLADDYTYDVVAQKMSDAYFIAENLFLRCMATFPRHFEKMRDFHRQSLRPEA